MVEKKDIFICHASEDKEEIVRPMVKAFDQAGITCWYDEAEIDWGDSITQKVNEGLRVSQNVVVVFSDAFIGKNWPERELNAVLNKEASSGEVKVLPLLVGSEKTQARILTTYPLLNDKRYLPWDGDRSKIVAALLSRLRKAESADGANTSTAPGKSVGLRVPLPKIKKEYTQLDKDMFLREASTTVKAYFQNALTELERAYEEVQTDYMEIHNFKFICTIYVRGEVASRCKIWLGGLTSSDSIAYQTGEFSIDSDNSFNALLQVEDRGESLGFNSSRMWFGAYEEQGDRLINAQEAAELLWRKFTDTLGYFGSGLNRCLYRTDIPDNNGCYISAADTYLFQQFNTGAFQHRICCYRKPRKPSGFKKSKRFLHVLPPF